MASSKNIGMDRKNNDYICSATCGTFPMCWTAKSHQKTRPTRVWPFVAVIRLGLSTRKVKFGIVQKTQGKGTKMGRVEEATRTERDDG